LASSASRLVILGTGALGRYYAYRLRDYNPIVIGTTPPPYAVYPPDRPEPDIIHPAFLPWEAPLANPASSILLAVKWAAMPRILTWISQNAPTAQVFSLMNGMGQEDIFRRFSGITFLAGVTTDALTRVDPPDGPAGVFLRATGHTWMSMPDSGQPGDFPPWPDWSWESSDTIQERRWQKLLQNSVINPLSALTGVNNGELPTHPIWRLAPPLLDEARTVWARATGQDRPLEPLVKTVQELAEATRSNRSSMLQDVLATRPTEIQAINGFLLRQGRRYGLSLPTHEAVVTLIERMAPTPEALWRLLAPETAPPNDGPR